MSERMTQERLDRTARSHLLRAAALVETIGDTDGALEDGYAELDIRREELTMQGQVFIGAAREIIFESACHLWELGGKTTDRQDPDFLDRVQGLLAITAHVMAGVTAKGRVYGEPEGLTPTWALHTLYWRYYRPLLEHPKAKSENPACIHGEG